MPELLRVPERLRLGVLVSGTGTNLQSLLDACEANEIPAEVAVVISNVPDAFALERARRAGVSAIVIDHRAVSGAPAFEAALRQALEAHRVGLVCLAGFLKILSPAFVAAFAGRVMNIHPALLPAFGGKGMYGGRVHETVLASGVRVSGCTVHFVTEEPDAGPIIAQTAVPVLDDDTPQTLAARVRTEELRLYPQAVRLFAEGRLRIVGRRVRILPEAEPHAVPPSSGQSPPAAMLRPGAPAPPRSHEAE